MSAWPHASGEPRSIISLRPLGVERAKLDHAKKLLELLSTGLMVGSFDGTPENGMIRLNGTDIKGYASGIWKSLTSDGGEGSLIGGGTVGKPAEWNTTTDLGNAAAATFKQILNVGSGARTVYTVPAGKKALVLGLKWMAEDLDARPALFHHLFDSFDLALYPVQPEAGLCLPLRTDDLGFLGSDGKFHSLRP